MNVSQILKHNPVEVGHHSIGYAYGSSNLACALVRAATGTYYVQTATSLTAFESLDSAAAFATTLGTKPDWASMDNLDNAPPTSIAHRNLARIARKCVEYPHRKAVYIKPLNEPCKAIVERLVLVLPDLLKAHCVARAEDMAIATLETTK